MTLTNLRWEATWSSYGDLRYLDGATPDQREGVQQVSGLAGHHVDDRTDLGLPVGPGTKALEE
ncbi:MAG: hypothetical protein AMXMBFR33_01290 [Candidatus Xenobia bacterium]